MLIIAPMYLFVTRFSRFVLGALFLCAAVSAELRAEEGAGSVDVDESAPVAAPSAGVALMALDEVKPGMKGEWRTVVSGTKIERFPLEIIGVADNFIGPRRPVIIAKAMDDRNILSGPVAGMSGSPVFIDGRLVGAYAYGYTWPKEQALIGITPIADMLEIAERFNDQAPDTFPAGAGRVTWVHGEKSASSDDRPAVDELQSLFEPLPSPLFVSGVSSNVLRHFKPELEKYGLDVVSSPGGRSRQNIDVDLEPGSAVAGVLMSGDFNMAGVGTVTYRDGDNIIAFGHPFFSGGRTEIPMATAEVMTVVQAVRMSFKLSNTGPIVGSIFQDRLTGIMGEIGRDAPVTSMSVRTVDQRGKERRYNGDLFIDVDLSPVISAIALAESLVQTMEAVPEQTFRMSSRWNVDGFEPFEINDIASGPGAAFQLAGQHLSLFRGLLNNPFEIPKIQSIDFDIELEDEWKLAQLDAVYVGQSRVRAGRDVELLVHLRHYRGDTTVHTVRVPIPEELKGESVRLTVADASTARRMDDSLTAAPRSVGDIVDRMRDRPTNQAFYVRLVRDSDGMTIDGKSLPGLPPSVAAVLRSPASRFPSKDIRQTIVWEEVVPLRSHFQGQHTIVFDVE